MTASDDDLIQKGQDDLIRRGDARRILEEEGFLGRSLANINNLPAVQVTAYSENDVAALVKDRDQAWEVAHAATDRGMRAEAALAAQIETDAGIADHYADQDYCAMGYPEEGGIAASGTADMIRREIRSQPHDRSALDRMLAEHEVRLREAREISEAEKIAIRNKALRNAADEMEDERAKQAILALIDKKHGV